MQSVNIKLKGGFIRCYLQPKNRFSGIRGGMLAVARVGMGVWLGW